MKLREHAVPITAAILVLAVSACGSSGSNEKSSSATTTGPRTSESPQVDPTFKARAAAVCKAVGDELRAQGSFPVPDFNAEHPEVSKLPAVGDYEAKTVATERSWLAQLRALGQPSSGESAWTLFLARIENDVKETAAQQVAARRGDGAAFTATFHELTSEGLSNDQIAAQVGLPSCDPGTIGTSNTKQPVPVRKP
jgi:hypothetical protein